MKHPIQPVVLDKHNTPRFKENPLVKKLLDVAGYDCLYSVMASDDDWDHLSQLIGYSLSGLPFRNWDTYEAALKMYKEGSDEKDARIEHLENKLELVKRELQVGIAALYNIHPDDLMEG